MSTAEAQATAPRCEHHWTSRHEPGHIVYWVRTCVICGNVDWDDLDREIAADSGRQRVMLRTVVWHDENQRPEAAEPATYANPPPWPAGTWEITKFEVREGGAVLDLWFSAIPAQPESTATIPERK